MSIFEASPMMCGCGCGPMPTHTRCMALTAKGSPCKRPAVYGWHQMQWCGQHAAFANPERFGKA